MSQQGAAAALSTGLALLQADTSMTIQRMETWSFRVGAAGTLLLGPAGPTVGPQCCPSWPVLPLTHTAYIRGYPSACDFDDAQALTKVSKGRALQATLSAKLRIVHLYPWTAVVPLLLLGAMLAGGIVGVKQAISSSQQNARCGL